MSNKEFWKSRTLWVAALGMVGALLLTFGWDSQFQTWIALEAPLMGILTIIFRWKATTTLIK